MGEKNPLLVRRCYFGKNIEITFSGGRASAKQKNNQSKITKKRQMSEQAERGNRKGRKVIDVLYAKCCMLQLINNKKGFTKHKVTKRNISVHFIGMDASNTEN